MTDTTNAIPLTRKERKAKRDAETKRFWRQCARKALAKAMVNAETDDERRAIDKNLEDLDEACLAAGDQIIKTTKGVK